MDQISLVAENRTALGKKVGALRRSGITPFHIYGPTTESIALQASTADLVHALNQAGYTTPLTVNVADQEHFVMVQHIQTHPVTDRLLHADLLAISRTQRVRAAVPLRFEGDSLAAREEGAQVVEDLHELELEALALEMPRELTVDISVLTSADSSIRAGDLGLPANVILISDADAIVVRISHRRAGDGDETGLSVEDDVASSTQVGSSADTPESNDTGDSDNEG